ncbi:hypothetical protein [Nocardia sp. IFM 10818]
MLEVLRAVAVRNEPGPQRYADLAAADTVRALTEPVVVTRLVRAREHTTALPLTAGHAYDLLIAAICQLFGVAPGPQELIATLHTFPVSAHLLDGFQHAVIAATIILYGPPGLRCAAAAALHVILTAIDPATLTSARPALDALAAISPVEFRRGIDHPNHVLRQHLQALRRDYYGWLGPHNFGRCPVTNYRGPAPTTPPNVRRSAHG